MPDRIAVPAHIARTGRPLAWRLRRAGICAVLLLAATLMAWLVDGAVSLASQALIYLLPVVLTAVYLESIDAVISAVIGSVLLNFLFIPPRYTFVVEGPEYVLSLSALLGVSIVISALVTKLKRETAAARRGEARTATLHALGQALAQADGEVQIAEQTVAAAAQSFDAAVDLRIAGADHRAQIVAAAPPGRAVEVEADAIRWVLEHNDALGAGTRNWPTLPACVVPLAAQSSCIGVLAVDLRESTRAWRPDDAAHLQALARLAAAALQRTRLSDAARRAAAAAELESTRSALLASISHDLRTPLAVIVGSASALREQGEQLDRQRQAELLRTIEAEAEHMATVADNALQLARLSTGSLALRRDWESLEEIVGSVVARMRRREPSPAISVRVAAGLPLVRVDAVLIAQVLANLIENSLVHAPEGGPIEVEARPLADAIELSVADRGPGFGNVDPRRLFDRRGAGAVPSDRSRGGAGLGLPICKAIVEAHGGTIAAANRAGGGAVVRFTLPLAGELPGIAA